MIILSEQLLMQALIVKNFCITSHDEYLEFQRFLKRVI